MDNYATHKAERARKWLARRRHWHVHFTPTLAPWHYQIERWVLGVHYGLRRKHNPALLGRVRLPLEPVPPPADLVRQPLRHRPPAAARNVSRHRRRARLPRPGCRNPAPAVRPRSRGAPPCIPEIPVARAVLRPCRRVLHNGSGDRPRGRRHNIFAALARGMSLWINLIGIVISVYFVWREIFRNDKKIVRLPAG